MSLSSVLADSASPLRRLVADELPDFAALRADYRSRLPAGAQVVRPNPPEGTRPAWGTLGLAIDHRIRCALSDARPTDDAVVAGIRAVSSPRLELPPAVADALRRAGAELVRAMDSHVAECRPFDCSRRLTDPQERRLDRLCVVSAWFEEIYRSGRLPPGTPLGDVGADVDLDALIASVPEYAVADVAALVPLADTGLAAIRRAPGEVRIGPTFVGSRDVGAADADWIAAGVLVDVKATTAPSRLDAGHIRQLACYALLDYDDLYEIERVGWYLARLGHLVTWDIDEFFDLLGAAYPVGDLRQLFADVLGRPTTGS